MFIPEQLVEGKFSGTIYDTSEDLIGKKLESDTKIKMGQILVLPEESLDSGMINLYNEYLAYNKLQPKFGAQFRIIKIEFLDNCGPTCIKVKEQ